MNSNISKTIDAFFSNYPQQTLSANSLITLAGQDPHCITYLINGVVEQYHITPQGNKVVVNVYKPPAFFPMSWAVNQTPNKYFFESLTQCTVVQADPKETVAFLQGHPDVMFDLLSRVYRGTDALLQRIILTSSGIAVNRLIFELLVEAFRFGAETDSEHRIVKIKQHVLATRTGLARETVSRELHKLADENYLALTKNGIVLNIPHLEKLLDSTS